MTKNVCLIIFALILALVVLPLLNSVVKIVLLALAIAAIVWSFNKLFGSPK